MNFIDFTFAMNANGYNVRSSIISTDDPGRVEFTVTPRGVKVRVSCYTGFIRSEHIGDDGVVEPWAWRMLSGGIKRMAERAAN